jgi:hypothetical protein
LKKKKEENEVYSLTVQIGCLTQETNELKINISE